MSTESNVDLALGRLLTAVWREVARSADLRDATEGLLAILRPALPLDHLAVRLIERERSAIDTLAVAARPGVTLPAHVSRTVLDGRRFNEVVDWVRGGATAMARHGHHSGPLEFSLPAVPGHVLAGPLVGGSDVLGVAAVSRQGAPFDSAEHEIFDAVLEPLAAALANHVRLHALTRSREALEADKRALLSRLDRQDVTDVLVGGDTGLSDVLERVAQVGPTDVPVLLFGETGTGKEVIARAVHAKSRRASGPVVRVNCGAISPGLVDSELFGHEKGSFTGAVAARQGWFERADGGTLFLDEIGELPLDAQVRLLRILQDGTFERVGGQRTLTVDVRVVAATHRNLEEMVAIGTFRQDLWYRLSVFPIRLPPLRERRADIPLLAAHYAWRVGMRLAGAPLVVEPEDLERLVAYSWPGNVRELAAVIERAGILGGGHSLRVEAALGIQPTQTASRSATHRHGASVGGEAASGVNVVLRPLARFDDHMRTHIEAVLRRTGGRVQGPSGAAKLLALNPFTLRSKMRKLGISPRAVRLGSRNEVDPPRVDGSPGAVHHARTGLGDGPVTFHEAASAHVRAALEQSAGRLEGPSGAAALLDVNPYTLRARMRRLGIDGRTYRQRHTS